MDENTKTVSFRSSMGGFNKQDVIDYISEENRLFAEERASLEKRINEALTKNAETDRRIYDIQRSFNDLIQLKDREIAEKAAALQKKDEEIASLNEKIALERSEYDAQLAELARLRAIIEGCNEQMKQYTERISILESGYNSRETDLSGTKAQMETLEKENDYLKRKYIQLQEEYTSLLERSKVQQVPTRTQSQQTRVPADYPRRSGNAGREKISDKEFQDISQKTIDTIKSINSDLRGYVDSCVGEFDSYTRDVTVGISKLLEDIALRCRDLDERIKRYKEEVSDNIDLKFTRFN